jgi:hypothetical protein
MEDGDSKDALEGSSKGGGRDAVEFARVVQEYA